LDALIFEFLRVKGDDNDFPVGVITVSSEGHQDATEVVIVREEIETEWRFVAFEEAIVHRVFYSVDQVIVLVAPICFAVQHAKENGRFKPKELGNRRQRHEF